MLWCSAAAIWRCFRLVAAVALPCSYHLGTSTSSMCLGMAPHGVPAVLWFLVHRAHGSSACPCVQPQRARTALQQIKVCARMRTPACSCACTSPCMRTCMHSKGSQEQRTDFHSSIGCVGLPCPVPNHQRRCQRPTHHSACCLYLLTLRPSRHTWYKSSHLLFQILHYRLLSNGGR